jgi:threonine aldolase
MARALAEGLLRLHLEVDLQAVQTNMVYVQVPQAPALVQRLRELGVLANAMGPRRVRFVTHRDLRDEDIPQALKRIEQALQTA